VYSQWHRFGNAERSEDAETNSQGYAKLYYPGTPDPGKATVVAVKAGEEVPSLEMLMRQVLVYRVRGHVYNQITHKPGRETDLVLVLKDHQWDFTEHQAMVEKADGSFEIPEVLPGSYVLMGFWFDEGKVYSTRVNLDIGSADLEGVSVTLGPGTSVSGRIVWEGQPSLDQDELTVQPRPKDAPMGFAGKTRVNPDYTFTLKDVSDGTYTADVSGASKDCYIQDVQYAGSSALDEGFTVTGPSPGFLEITISSRGARIQGAVTDADGLPAAGVWVVLVPEKPRRPQVRLFKTQTTDQYGRFDLRGIAPGDYRLFSWDEVEQGAWEDPEFLKPFEEKGEKVLLQQGEAKSLDVITITTKGVEPEKQ
jgi:hypothetical protein